MSSLVGDNSVDLVKGYGLIRRSPKGLVCMKTLHKTMHCKLIYRPSAKNPSKLVFIDGDIAKLMSKCKVCWK